MSTELTTSPEELLPAKRQPKTSALVAMASRLAIEPEKMLSTLKSTVFKGATNEELAALVVVANEYDLNPFLKELYAFPAKGGGIVPVVSVDGWIKIINRHPLFDGLEFEMVGDGEKPEACTCVIYIKGRSRPVRVTEYYSECSRNTEPWNKSPRRMLRHKSLIQGGRVAFGFSGIQDEDEALASGEVELPLKVKSPEFSPAKAKKPKETPAQDAVQAAEAREAAEQQAPVEQRAAPANLPGAIDKPGRLAWLRSSLLADGISDVAAETYAKGIGLLGPTKTLDELPLSRLVLLTDSYQNWSQGLKQDGKLPFEDLEEGK